MDLRRRLTAAVFAAALFFPAFAGAAVPAPTHPSEVPAPPAGFEIDAREALAVADEHPKVAEQTNEHGPLEAAIAVEQGGAWRVGYSAGGEERVLVMVDGVTGSVREAWTGIQVAWPLARGSEGQFGHVLNAPWVWIPLCLIFLAALVDWRRPLRIVHLDLLVMLAFGASHFFLNAGDIGLSVPLAYPVLLYLLARMIWLGLRGGEPLRPSAPQGLLVFLAVALVVFRIALNVADSGVIDVGYAGSIGADRITHGQPIYGEGQFPDDNPFGDTYGPANYYAYVPFELIFPWEGEWDELPSAHAAAIAFDLVTVLGLVVFGLRLRPGRPGRRLAAILAFAWLAYPYTAFALQSNSNDSLVAAFVAWSLALFARPLARGALLAAAGLVKFAPLALVPLFAAGERGLGAGTDPRPWWRRSPVVFTAGFAAVAALLLAHPAIDPGLGVFWERTIASQFDRESPFSIWGQVDMDGVKLAATAAAATLAIGLAFFPRRRSRAQIAGLAAALLIVAELLAEHWFYLYIPWFLPALLIALATAAPLRAVAAAEPGVGANPSR